MRAVRALLAALAAAPLAAGCLASTVVAPGQRAASAGDPHAWRAAAREDVPGLWSSVSLDGPCAAVLHEVHYWLAADGSFSGAALVRVPAPAYTTLSGRWRFEGGELWLSEDGLPATVEASDDLLRLSSEEGVLVLRRRAAP